MKISLTPQLLGDLIEKGFTYMLASSVSQNHSDQSQHIVLKPLKYMPVLQQLPDGYETFYRITHEPMQMCCGVEGVRILVEYDGLSEDAILSADEVYNDSYFRMSESYFRQVLDSLEDYAVFTTDTMGNVNSWNLGAEKVLGYTENEVLGLNSSVFFTTQDVAKGVPEQELETAIKNGRGIDERYHVRKDGTTFWGSGLVFPLYDEEHKHRGFTKIMRNIAEEKQARTIGSDL